MIAKVRPEGPSPPKPIRGRKITIKALMAWTLVVAVGLGLAVNGVRNHRRAQAIRPRVMSWFGQLMADGPLVLDDSYSMSYFATDLLLAKFQFQGKFKTPAGHPILVEGRVHVQPFRDLGQVVIEASGRRVTWPIEDIERGRKIDLKVEFPEAFR